MSLNTLQMLAAKEAALPGRKMILWVSPGWPLLSGPRIDLDAKQQQQIFAQVAELSTLLRRGRITLYSIDPLGANQSVTTQFYYEEFLKGVSKTSQVQLGDLGLQVLAEQSGGLALSGSNDISGQLARCVADASAYYELSFDPPPAEHPNEYHQLQIKVSTPGVSARTRTGYYAQP
jgi:VWFA-related protein